MNDKKISIDDVHVVAGYVSGASQALQVFVEDRFIDLNEISVDDLPMLAGMVAALVELTDKNKRTLDQFEKGSREVDYSGK